jgi:hypothetical protein
VVVAKHVSRLRWQAAEGGSAGLPPSRGRPAKLDRGGVAKAYEMCDQGVTGREIVRVLGVSATMISRLLARRPAREVQLLELGETAVAAVDVGEVTVADVADRSSTTTRRSRAGAWKHRLTS